MELIGINHLFYMVRVNFSCADGQRTVTIHDWSGFYSDQPASMNDWNGSRCYPIFSKYSKIFIPVAKVYHSKGRKTDMDRATWETLFITATPDSWEKINTILARPRRIAQGPSQTCKRMASFHYISLWTKLGDDLAIEYTSILLRKIIESDASQYTLWRSLAKYHLWLNHFTSTWCRFA